MIPQIEACISGMTKRKFLERAEKSGVPFAAVNEPGDMFEDPHLNASGGLLKTRTLDGRKTRLPALPLQIGFHRLGLPGSPPHLGQGSRKILEGIGLTPNEIERLERQGVLGKVH